MPTNGARLPSLADRLILFRYFNSLFGAKTFEELQEALRNLRTGYDAAARSHFFNALKGRSTISEDILEHYDANIRDDVTAINVRRPDPIQLKYFQYLAALYTEIFLDRRSNEPAAFLNDLNAFVSSENARMPYGAHYLPFRISDLNKIAYWMATGSGKTLLLHINYRQFLRYQPNPGDNILLVTPPGDLLAQQHLDELRWSSVPCITYNEPSPFGADNPVRVIEISKITKNKTGEGVSIDVAAFEGNNLIFVDEGHKGASGDAWMGLRDKLGADGFTFEYSATFGQAINTAQDADLLQEYSKAILFDYSYKYFYGDGYGKDYQVLNLREDRAEELTDTLFLANLLAFYEQARLFADRARDLKPYNLEAPLWVFIGSSVNAVYSEEREKKSDVLTVVLFLARVLRERVWAVRTIERILNGTVELKDKDGRDLFAGRFGYVRDLGTASQIYKDILAAFFRTSAAGILRLVDIKSADGEIGLKAGNADDYFGLINIGDTSAFFKLVDEEATLAHETDEFSDSLFDTINRDNSRINALIGSKKFIEGWSSWRVSTMGLLNIGRAEGTQIIQLFGRGVRLLGKGRSLQRSGFLPGPHPAHLPLLETLNIFGVRANYMSQFRDYLDREGVPSGGFEEITVPILANRQFLKNDLVVPRLKPNADFTTQYLALPTNLSPAPRLDLRPQVVTIASVQNTTATSAVAESPHAFQPQVLAMLDWDRLYVDLLEFKQAQGWHNLEIRRETVRQILADKQYSLYAPEFQVIPKSYADLSRIQRTASAVLEKYVEEFYHRERSRWSSQQMEYRVLGMEDDNLNFKRYTLKVPANQTGLVRQIRQIIADAERLFKKENAGLPRVHFDRHLYQPLLAHLDDVTAAPPALDEHERALVARIRDWLKANSTAIAGKDVFLLRNQSRGHGIGFFEDAGFYPDFILWIKQGKKQHLVFIDPHGMLLNSDPEDGKVQLPKQLMDIERSLGNPNITLDSFIISTTDFARLITRRAWRDHKRPDFANVHVLFEDDDLLPIFGI